jgi:hypothetical protein
MTESRARSTSTADQPLYTELLRGFTIRLIELEEGEPEEEISIRLLIAELDFAPQFEALSYVWGDPTVRTPISCNGRPLNITLNLHAALLRARYIDRPRILWVDAICINQRNNKECSHHVSFMNKIYEKAKKVIVYMGDDPDGRAADVQSLLKEHVDRMKGYKTVKEMPVLAPNDPLFSDNRWPALATLMDCEWFKRAWVLQEVGVAKLPLVLYGKVEFKYRDLMNLARWIIRCAQSLQSKASINLFTIHTDWELWTPNWRETSDFPEYELLDFLSHAKMLKCRRYHDHIYAYLGHPLLQTEDGEGPVIGPDYDMPVEKVDRDLTAFLLKKSGLRVLSVIEHDEKAVVADLPSWVNRFGGVEFVQNGFGCYVGFYYRASGDFKPDPLFRIDGDTLFVTGMLIDKIKRVHQFSITSEDLEKPDALRNADPTKHEEGSLDRAWADINSGEVPCQYPIEKRLEVFGLTLCSGLNNFLRAEDNMPKHEADFAAYWSLRLKATGQSVPVNLQKKGEDGDADAFWFNMSLGCEGRCFYITENGYYGLGPWITEPGDVCYILLGANVPFVLRSGVGDGGFKLVGETYTHGLMLGEALGSTESSEIKLQ